MKNIQKVSLIVILLFALACPIPFSLAETIDNPTNNAVNEKSPKTLAPGQMTQSEGILLAQRERPKARRSRRGFFSFFRRRGSNRKTQTRKNTRRGGIFRGFRLRRRSGQRPGFFQRLRVRRQQRRIERSQRR